MTYLSELSYLDGKWYNKVQMGQLIPKNANRIYEVMRVIEGKALFLEDHFSRFEHSLAELNTKSVFGFSRISEIVNELIKRNNLITCNIRFEVILKDNSLLLASYSVPYSYPKPEQYLHGVNVASYSIERAHPHIKQSSINEIVRRKLAQIYAEEMYFEVVLVDRKANITEGSRTNVFFVKGNTIYSPPSEKILEGITRKKILQIATENSLQIKEVVIPLSSINEYDACFLTGTSPKILAVNKIDKISFDVENMIIRKLEKYYNKLIKKSLCK